HRAVTVDPSETPGASAIPARRYPELIKPFIRPKQFSSNSCHPYPQYLSALSPRAELVRETARSTAYGCLVHTATNLPGPFRPASPVLVMRHRIPSGFGLSGQGTRQDFVKEPKPHDPRSLRALTLHTLRS